MSPQSTIAHYRIIAKLGEGGMRTVYRAIDTKLNREVALKVLPDSFASDADRLARFAREAQLLAALNHPNIASIYGVEDRALVMELVEGPTLAGPLPIDEALPVARQIVEALEYAHEKGIIHRDLKPANIKLTPEGRVKILDFGLAKAISGEVAPNDPDISPTLTMRATMTGVILGTAAYMSPEQARGGVVDKRSDIWSFGVVLFEILTGRSLFASDTVSDTLAGVLKSDLDWSALSADTPPSIRRLLRRCLERDRRNRLRDVGDALPELDDAMATPVETLAGAPSSRWRPYAPWVIAIVLLVLAGWMATELRHERPAEPSIEASLLAPEKAPFAPIQPGYGGFALSPDGRALAFVATQLGKTLLWVQRLDSSTARPLPKTEDAHFPFWSPDSRFLGFFAGNSLKTIEVASGPPQAVCDVAVARGGTWNQHGVIVFSGLNGVLHRVPAAGGQPLQLTNLDTTRQELNHSWPWFLPDGRHFLFLARGGAGGNIIYASSIDAKPGAEQRVEIMKAVSNSIYAPSPSPGQPGWILFLRGSSLFARPFNPATLKLEGDALPVADSTGFATNSGFTNLSCSTSQTGVLVYGHEGGISQLIWLSRDGKESAIAAPPGVYRMPRLSPDGNKVAIAHSETQVRNLDVWLIDLLHGVLTRFTFDPAPDLFPLWSPKGDQIAFSSLRDGAPGIYLKAVNRAGNEEPILTREQGRGDAIYDWSRDGRYILYISLGIRGGADLWLFDVKERSAKPFLATPVNESQAQFSPDGRWVAYSSEESGRYEVYVRSFAGSAKFMISANGGGQPRWRGDGKELYYATAEGKMMAIAVKSTADSFEYETPKLLFESRALVGASGSGPQGYIYDVTRDGQRFLAIQHGDSGEPLTLVTNWPTRLKK